MNYNQIINPPYIIVEGVIDATTNEPTTPAKGDTYFNTTAGTSNVTSTAVSANTIIEWMGTSWKETTAQSGNTIFDKSTKSKQTFDGVLLNSRTSNGQTVTWFATPFDALFTQDTGIGETIFDFLEENDKNVVNTRITATGTTLADVQVNYPTLTTIVVIAADGTTENTYTNGADTIPVGTYAITVVGGATMTLQRLVSETESIGLRGEPVADNATLTALSAKDYERRKVLADGKEYVFELGAIFGTLADDANTGFWQEQITALESTRVDASSAAFSQTLSASTDSGNVLLFTNIDLANTATLAVQAGETLNGVTDGTFLFSNYSAGTQFRADEIAGGWVVSVVGASTEKTLDRFFTRGVSADMSFPNDGVWRLAIDLSSLVDGIDQIAKEYDPYSLRTGSTLTIKNTGTYRILMQGNHSQVNEDGTSGQNAFASQLQYSINGGTPITIGQETDTNEVDGELNGFELVDLVAGDILEFYIKADDNRQDEDYIIILDVSQLPSTETVLAGMIQPTDLAHVVYSLSADSVASLVCPFDEGQGDTGIITNSAGTITLPAGKYRIEAHASRQAGNLDYELYNVTTSTVLERYSTASDIGVTHPYYLTVTSPTEIQIREGDISTAVVWNGRQSGFDAGFDDVQKQWGTYIDIQQVPNSTIVMPDALEVEDATQVLFERSTPMTSGSYNLDNGLTWTDIINDYSFLVITAYNANNTTVYGGITVDLSAGLPTLVSFSEQTALPVDRLNVSSMALGGTTFSFGGDDVTNKFVRITGIKKQKTVINTTDTPITQQVISGVYVEDRGIFREMNGTSTSTGVTQHTVNFPVPFPDTSYKIKCQTTNGGNGQTISVTGKTTSGFSVTTVDINGTPQNNVFDWQAIGLKP